MSDTKYPGQPVDLGRILQALDAAAPFPSPPGLVLVPADLVELVRDAVAELSWRRDEDATS